MREVVLPLDPTASLLARSSGSGTGRFVARALLDPLENGNPLVGLCFHILGNATIADFVFSQEGGASHEVIRCHLGRQGELRECEVWRVPSLGPTAALDCEGLRVLLSRDDSIDSVELAANGISLRTPTGSASISS